MLVMLQFRKPQPWRGSRGSRWMHFHNWETMPKRQRANPKNKLAQTNINILPFRESLNKQMSLCIMHWGSIRPALTHGKKATGISEAENTSAPISWALGPACLVKETFPPFLCFGELLGSIFQSKRSLTYRKIGMSENELCHQLAYFQEISRTFEMNSPAGKLPNQLGWGGTGGGGGGMRKRKWSLEQMS